jgi:PAS domain S-box-containing protein
MAKRLWLTGDDLQSLSADELRKIVARHQRIFDSSSGYGFWDWDMRTHYFDWSGEFWRRLGYGEADAPYINDARRLPDLIHPDDREHSRGAIVEHLKTGIGVDVTFRVRAKDGSYRWSQCLADSVRDESGRAIYLSGINFDITRLKEAEETAEKANQAKSHFLSSMSHELRTPMNSILGFSQLFDFANNLTDNQRENIREIRKAGQHLLRLINDVLDLAKIESGKLTLSLEPVLPSRLVEECMSLMQSLADARQVSLHSDTAGLENVYLYADAVRLKQVILNLLSNAVKYNRNGGRVTIRFASPDSESLVIQVHDTGYGIPEVQYDAVFEPFNRLGAEQSETEGSGVGLVITRQLAEMMGGRLSFHSKLGEGTCFSVTFKRAEQWTADKAGSMDGHVRDQRHVELRINSERHVLYIEDNASNVRLMEQLLQRFPHVRLHTANEAFTGIYRARTEKPDLIILDINLPDIDGFEALKVLKQDPVTAHTPVIALSANAMPYDVQRGLKAGFQAYLTKPLIVAELIDTLNELL